MNAMFKVVYVDPEGSGLDWSGHLGVEFEGYRCCKNCTIIFGTDGNFGPFVIGELEPLNEQAIEVMWDVLTHREEQKRRAKFRSAKVTRTKEFQKALALLTGEVYFDAPAFEVKKELA